METRRLFVEKRPGFDLKANHLLEELREHLSLSSLEKVRIINRYDVAGLDESLWEEAISQVLSDPITDQVYREKMTFEPAEKVFASRYLPGQYDQRADSAGQCIQILTCGQPVDVSFATVLALEPIIDEDLERVKDYLINQVDSEEVSLEKKNDMEGEQTAANAVAYLDGFNQLDDQGLQALHGHHQLAMSLDDLSFTQTYFKEEDRDPSITELKVLDTYWSDHCRHSTFLAQIDQVDFPDSTYGRSMEAAHQSYLEARNYVYSDEDEDRPICLMDLAVIAMKKLKKSGVLDNLDESDEINACSIEVPVEVDGKIVPYLVMFKNETHNHPTEIEPLGGAGTCLGGAIRDPLSGRSYVYVAMRVTGSADPRTPISETLENKLPQRTICQQAALGYASYGNQIGIAAGQVREIYHPGYMAKRMEVGAVIGAAPKDQVVREKPLAGDVVVLVGGRTGRDGCGGATGSSQEHDETSAVVCSAQVQKGNPITERKIQRLFAKAACARLIKKCNDFGAGGVSVAIGELADGLEIYLDDVPTKYPGLDGTELAISESQERMAVVLDPGDWEAFAGYCQEENVEATVVARVTAEPSLVIHWGGDKIVNLKRSFLDSAGVRMHSRVQIADGPTDFLSRQLYDLTDTNWKDIWQEVMTDLNVGLQKGLVEQFDGSAGSASVLMPFGGLHQSTPSEGVVAKIPVNGKTDDATSLTFGFDPDLSMESPYLGGQYAVASSVIKSVCLGANLKDARLTFQEYFEALGEDPIKWGKPWSALLGAFRAQDELSLAAIGGKDSMSGTYKDLDVPPTLISFACTPTKASTTISQELKTVGAQLYYLPLPLIKEDTKTHMAGEIDFKSLKELLSQLHEEMQEGHIEAASQITSKGMMDTLSKMAFGNRLGLELEIDLGLLGRQTMGGIILSATAPVKTCIDAGFGKYIGTVLDERSIKIEGEGLYLGQVYQACSQVLASVYPSISTEVVEKARQLSYPTRNQEGPAMTVAKPRVFIPVFPGTNCEVDSARAFDLAGGKTQVEIFRNLRPKDMAESLKTLEKAIREANILMLAGGFSSGDEPDGAAKYIATILRHPRIQDAIDDLMNHRDGLILGIGNGFQALIKTGLLPYGDIRNQAADDPILTANTLGRHVSCYVHTRVSSVLSPWLGQHDLGDLHRVPVSHGEGRLVASQQMIEAWIDQGQIAIQYVDDLGMATHRPPHNPNGSMMAIEALTSVDGRILGKMGHSERVGQDIAKNIPGDKYQKLFTAGVDYFRL